MENTFDTDEQLRKALGDFEAIPDSRSFDAILEKMHQKKKRRLFIIFFWTGLIALSGIVVPLMLSFYDTEKPSTASTAETQAVASAQNKADTDRAHATLTSPDLHTKHRASSSIETTFSYESPGPEAKTDPAGSPNRYRGVSAVTLSSAPEKNHPEKKSPEQAGNAGFAVIGLDPEPNYKTSSALSAPEEASTASDVMYMTVIQIPLPIDSGRKDVSAFLIEGAYPVLFLAPEKKNTFSFYLGAQASPQLNSFVFSKNPNRNPSYNTSGINFSDFYLDIKKGQNQFNVSLPFGIKTGLQINNTYELLIGVAYQSFIEKEKLYTVGSSTVSPVDPSLANAYASAPMTNKNSFRYLCYSLEANRLFHVSKAIGFKLGAGIQLNQLIRADYVFVESPNRYGQTSGDRKRVSPLLATGKLKAGVVFNANRRFQLHISPGFFYSPTSLFRKEYVIRQKPFGMDVECLMLFRLFHR